MSDSNIFCKVASSISAGVNVLSSLENITKSSILSTTSVPAGDNTFISFNLNSLITSIIFE